MKHYRELTNSERLKRFRFEISLSKRTITRLERENKLLKDKIEFLELSRPTSMSWGRGAWIKRLKVSRKKKVKK